MEEIREAIEKYIHKDYESIGNYGQDEFDSILEEIERLKEWVE